MTTLISTKTNLWGRSSLPGILLRLEGLTVLGGALTLYAYQGYNWWMFALLLLSPDVALAAYAIDQRMGSLAYNLMHTYVFPILLALLSLVFGYSLGLQLALIWLAHIGMDRAVGYGLKYPTSFKDTHLSRV
jgi:hypothetical protein